MPTFKDVNRQDLLAQFNFIGQLPHAVDVAARRWARANGFESGWWDGEIGAGDVYGVFNVSQDEAEEATMTGLTDQHNFTSAWSKPTRIHP